MFNIKWMRLYFKCMFIELTRPRETTFFFKDKEVSRWRHMFDMHRALVGIYKLKGSRLKSYDNRKI